MNSQQLKWFIWAKGRGVNVLTICCRSHPCFEASPSEEWSSLMGWNERADWANYLMNNLQLWRPQCCLDSCIKSSLMLMSQFLCPIMSSHTDINLINSICPYLLPCLFRGFLTGVLTEATDPSGSSPLPDDNCLDSAESLCERGWASVSYYALLSCICFD